MSASCCSSHKQEDGRQLATKDWNLPCVQASSRKTVLFVALDSIGHINTLILIANWLKKRGHRTVFLFADPMDAGLKQAGHEVYDCSSDQLVESEPTAQSEFKWVAFLETMQLRNQTVEMARECSQMALKTMMQHVKDRDAIFARKLELIKPDLFIIDHFFMQPAILKYGKPWSLVYSASPLGLHPNEHNLPVGWFGIPTQYRQLEDAGKRDYYATVEKLVRQDRQELFDEWNQFLVDECKVAPSPTNPISFLHLSKQLNVYMYPLELDYGLPVPNWQRCDSILRSNMASLLNENCKTETNGEKCFEVPEKLKGKPGKLIFLSMGTILSGHAGLMKHLVSILAKSPHKFIVSMGVNWDKYELADNMWGQKYVDQLAILPEIDLIITHGGNNTLTECFYFGVPGYIVCPGFGDQKDNAQRIEECKLGKWIKPFDCTETELLSAIEEVLDDPTIRPRMKAIAERMQLPENKFKVIKLFTDFVETDHAE